MATSSIIATWNGEERDLDQVFISPNDRGFVFGDGVYEVLRVYNGKAYILEDHLARLSLSLKAARIAMQDDLGPLILRNIEQNGITEGMVYLQVTRGAAPRLHSFFNLDIKPNILIYSKHFAEHPFAKDAERGIKAITLEDLRSGLCHIKSLNLMANCMAQTAAHEKGASEAILFRNNNVLSEGSSSNVFIAKDSIVRTPPLSGHLLAGTRRKLVIEKFRLSGIDVHESVLTRADVTRADEIFITSTIREATAVIELDGQKVGSGAVGPMARKARELILMGTKL